jgi:ribonuclease-3
LKDPKTRLQEYLQARQLDLPEYNVLDISGDAHAQSFQVSCAVQVPGRPVTKGEARNRRHAEQEAAAKMLELLDAG